MRPRNEPVDLPAGQARCHGCQVKAGSTPLERASVAYKEESLFQYKSLAGCDASSGVVSCTLVVKECADGKTLAHFVPRPLDHGVNSQAELSRGWVQR